MGSDAKKTTGAKRADLLLFDPTELVIVKDKKHPLYDERIHLPLSEGLVRNIMLHGVLEPIIVRRNGQKENGEAIVEVVAGRQRVRAAIEANIRLEKEGGIPIFVPAVIRRGEDTSMLAVMISENEIKHSDEILIKARKAQRFLDRGHTTADVAIVFGVSEASIKNYLALLDCDQTVQEAVGSGELAADVARKLSKLTHKEQKKALKEMVKTGATKGRKAHAQADGASGKTGRTALGKKQAIALAATLFDTARSTGSGTREHHQCASGAELLLYVFGEGPVPNWLPQPTSADAQAEE